MLTRLPFQNVAHMCLLLIHFVLKVALETTAIRNQTSIIWDENELVSWKKGSGRIIISVPHDGHLKPDSVPDRGVQYGCLTDLSTCDWSENCEPKDEEQCKIVTHRDFFAQEIASLLFEKLNHVHLSPHLIVNHLDRKKMDPNRPIDEGAQSNELAKKSYTAYHTFIKEARQMIVGPGLYLDIHGHSQNETWTELGYRISRKDLNAGSATAEFSSIKALFFRTLKIDGKHLITGNTSFGAFLYRADRLKNNVMPSPLHPKPGTTLYFRGGYSILHYGSMRYGCIDAIQIEIPQSIRLNGTKIYESFASDLADAVRSFMTWHRYFAPDEELRCPQKSGSICVPNYFLTLVCIVVLIILSRTWHPQLCSFS